MKASEIIQNEISHIGYTFCNYKESHPDICELCTAQNFCHGPTDEGAKKIAERLSGEIADTLYDEDVLKRIIDIIRYWFVKGVTNCYNCENQSKSFDVWKEKCIPYITGKVKDCHNWVISTYCCKVMAYEIAEIFHDRIGGT